MTKSYPPTLLGRSQDPSALPRLSRVPGTEPLVLPADSSQLNRPFNMLAYTAESSIVNGFRFRSLANAYILNSLRTGRPGAIFATRFSNLGKEDLIQAGPSKGWKCARWGRIGNGQLKRSEATAQANQWSRNEIDPGTLLLDLVLGFPTIKRR